MSDNFQSPDPAAVFTCALSLWRAFEWPQIGFERAQVSEVYNGFDEFMREIMRVADIFERWACTYVAFDVMQDVWPYLLEEKFGSVCLDVVTATGLKEFEEGDCLQVAWILRLPIRFSEKLPLPVDVVAENPVSGSAFLKLRIQTVRHILESEDCEPFVLGDDPFNADFGPPHFALYGVEGDGTLEHIADRRSFTDAVILARKISPNIAFPNDLIFHPKH